MVTFGDCSALSALSYAQAESNKAQQHAAVIPNCFNEVVMHYLSFNRCRIGATPHRGLVVYRWDWFNGSESKDNAQAGNVILRRQQIVVAPRQYRQPSVNGEYCRTGFLPRGIGA